MLVLIFSFTAGYTGQLYKPESRWLDIPTSALEGVKHPFQLLGYWVASSQIEPRTFTVTDDS